MKKLRLGQSSGFTLIELLIVIAIIGVLAALLIPNGLTAINKAKQKGTMNDIIKIGIAIESYALDNGFAPTHIGGAYTASDPFYASICPFYVKVLPLTDKYGGSYQVWTGNGVTGNYGITGAVALDYLIASYGHDKVVETWSFLSASPEAGFFSISSNSDFNKDLVYWSGFWIRVPSLILAGT